MARGPAPDSASCQFFINQVENEPLDYVAGAHAGYAVFGRVTEGMDVVDEIGSVKTGPMDDPVEPVVMEKVTIQR